MKIKRAIISVHDKTGVVKFAQGLSEFGIKIISTGGTAEEISQAGIPIIQIRDLPGSFAEMLGGRVKTLQPTIHATLLVKQNNPQQLAEIAQYQIEPVQLLVVNFYPWEKKIAEIGLTIDEIIEQGMDIGGPTMVSSGIKNYPFVTTVVDPSDYKLLLSELKATGEISLETRQELATKAAFEVAWYSYQIWRWVATTLSKKQELFPERLLLGLEKIMDLRYGENPHQRAAFYRQIDFFNQPAITQAKFLQGQPPSATTIMDLNAALETVREFTDAFAAVVIKHGTICGQAIGEDKVTTYIKAREVDSKSAFGGVLGFNFVLDKATAQEIVSTKIDGVIALGFEEGVLEILKKRKKMPVFELDAESLGPLEHPTIVHKPVVAGLIRQETDALPVNPIEWKVVTGEVFPHSLIPVLEKGWLIVKHVKSNAITILSKDGDLLGVGGGQVSRIGSAKIALNLAGEKAKGAILFSDALIPFPDLVELAAERGISIIVQTGGSKNDDQVITAAKKAGIKMIFTKRRGFYH